MNTSSQPKAVGALVEALRMLPGIGPKAALRIAMTLLKQPSSITQRLVEALTRLHAAIARCTMCFRYDDQARMIGGRCRICSDPRRDGKVLCVVAESSDSDRIEASNQFTGRYYVFGGLIDPLEGITIERLNSAALIEYIEHSPDLQEILFALNLTIQGETTLITMERMVRERFPRLVLTRLGRGLPINSEIEYVDEVTMRAALEHRQVVTHQG